MYRLQVTKICVTELLRSHQKNLRADLYSGGADALIQADMEPLNPANLGKKILPSVFVGGDCWMIWRFCGILVD